MHTVTQEQLDRHDYKLAAKVFSEAAETGFISPNDQPYLLALLLGRFMRDMPCAQHEVKTLDDIMGLIMEIGARIDDPVAVEFTKRARNS